MACCSAPSIESAPSPSRPAFHAAKKGTRRTMLPVMNSVGLRCLHPPTFDTLARNPKHTHTRTHTHNHQHEHNHIRQQVRQCNTPKRRRLRLPRRCCCRQPKPPPSTPTASEQAQRKSNDKAGSCRRREHCQSRDAHDANSSAHAFKRGGGSSPAGHRSQSERDVRNPCRRAMPTRAERATACAGCTGAPNDRGHGQRGPPNKHRHHGSGAVGLRAPARQS